MSSHNKHGGRNVLICVNKTEWRTFLGNEKFFKTTVRLETTEGLIS